VLPPDPGVLEDTLRHAAQKAKQLRD